MTADNEVGSIVEDGALEPPVIDQETARLDQIDSHPQTRREPQQGSSVLRNVRFEQGEAHLHSTIRTKSNGSLSPQRAERGNSQ
jgi:hypothetical protein